MFFLKKLFNFYINSSIHVALSVFSLSWITLINFSIPYDRPVLYFIFFASITGYNFVKYFGLAKFHHRSLAVWLKAIQVFSFVCFLLMIYYACLLNPRSMFFIACFGIITFFYAMPFFPKLDSEHNLRNVSGLKVYIIGLVWSGVTVILPLFDNDMLLDLDVLITSTQRFIYIIVLMLPFEIRDLQYDSLKLGTIPQKLGVKRTKIMGVLLLVVFFFLEFFKENTHAGQSIVLFNMSLITMFFVIRASRTQGKYYSSFWVEGLPILWLILLLLFT